MEDGLYQTTTPYLCAVFVIKNKKPIMIAPILIKRFSYWAKLAKRVEEEDFK